jgi:hypothetical protein
MEPEPLIESSFCRLLASLDAWIAKGPLGAAFFSEKTTVDVDVLMIFEGLATFVDSHLRFLPPTLTT